MSPIIVDKQEKRQQIVQAALTVFSKQGFATTSMDKIAEAAGMGKSTLYEYFENKADLFIAALEAWVEQVGQQTAALMEKRSDPVEKLYVIMDLAMEMAHSRDPAMSRLYIEVCGQSLAETGGLHHRGDLINDMTAGIRRILTDVILQGISVGVFKSEIARDAEKIAINIIACLDGLLLDNLLGIFRFDLKWQINYYLTNLIETIRVPAQTATRNRIANRENV